MIEGAIRFARQTIQHWQAGYNERALEAIIRCRNIVSELLSSVRVDESELTKRVASLYLFVFQNLTEAQLRRDGTLVEEAISVLEIERKTWRQRAYAACGAEQNLVRDQFAGGHRWNGAMSFPLFAKELGGQA